MTKLTQCQADKLWIHHSVPPCANLIPVSHIHYIRHNNRAPSPLSIRHTKLKRKPGCTLTNLPTIVCMWKCSITTQIPTFAWEDVIKWWGESKAFRHLALGWSLLCMAWSIHNEATMNPFVSSYYNECLHTYSQPYIKPWALLATVIFWDTESRTWKPKLSF